MPAPTRAQRLAVAVAFLVAALSGAIAVLRFVQHGEIAVTQIAGAILMVVLAISGYRRLANPRGDASTPGKDERTEE